MARTKAGKSNHRWEQIPRQTVPRSSFDLSHGWKSTFDCDYLVPMGVWDVIPGDSWNVKSTVVARLATPLHPIQDNIYIDTFYFFVPYRIIWDNFEKFMGAQDDPADSIDYTIPVLNGDYEVDVMSPADYMGIPVDLNFNNTADISALPLRAFRLIFNDWFRDENLTDSLSVSTGDGPDSVFSNDFYATADMAVYTRAKKHDYFTSALPWPQKGDPVSLPLGTRADVVGIGLNVTDTGSAAGTIATRQTGGPPTVNMDNTWVSGDPQLLFQAETGNTGYPDIYADLTNATAATINELRLAFQTQRLLERDARSGTRYVETLKAHWGVTFPDYTAQRPVYLGGGTQTVGITPVPQTNISTGTDPVDQKGSLAGYGYSSGQHGFTKSFVEHGVIIALVNGRTDITYSQGIDRYWTKSTRYDFYYPVLSQIGEQAILSKEIYTDGTASDQDVFGYTGRYNEYRFQNSKVTGKSRPDASGTLAAWNLSEDFASRPTLGDTFIRANGGAPLDRALAVPAEPHFIADVWHDIKAARPLPLYGDPAGVGRF